ncbi:MAG: FlgO family outer membrane protein [Candidatus Brocadiaceae bacterium]
MQKSSAVMVLIGIALYFIMGCSTPPNRSTASAPSEYILDGDLVSQGYRIADELLSQLKVQIKPCDTILVASFVDINNLNKSTIFGRMFAEHVSSRLSQRGYKVIDMRLRTESVFMEECKGEFLLSRDLRAVSKNHNASAVVVGTYGESAHGIYVSARIINPSDSAVISSCDYGLIFPPATLAALTRK